MLLRVLPLSTKSITDHLVKKSFFRPKGTFIQLDSKVIPVYAQRKQQQHDPQQWKGVSAILDLTEHLSLQDMSTKYQKGTPTNLQFCLKDGELYGIQIALCEYISHETLFDICMSIGTKGSIAKMNYEDGLKHAMKHFEKETLILDDSDDENDDNQKAALSSSYNDIPNLSCSLRCPVSMQTIKTPVRGKKCMHLSCFDLETYLENNSKVSGGRWRCFICEEFIPVCDLVYDGFIAQVLETHGHEITSIRDKMELCNDGTWNLCEETTTSSMKRVMKRKLKEADSSSTKLPRQNLTREAEVIDLDNSNEK